MSNAAGAHELYDAVVAEVIVWVEDALTEAYLNKLWADDRIRILVAGSGPTVKAVTTDARVARHMSVFGVRDRDFGKTNFGTWTKYDKEIRVFRLPRHEIENYLLDWHALAGCSENRRGKKAHDIEAEVKKHATSLDWWLSAKRTLSDLSANLSRDFPRGLGQTKIKDHKDALDYILTCRGWYQHVCDLPKTSLNEAKIKSLLTKHQEHIHRALDNGKWIEAFPGKELLGKAKAFIRTRPKARKKATDDIDLAKAIANWQVDNKRPPSDLVTLRECLLQRAGIAHPQ